MVKAFEHQPAVQRINDALHGREGGQASPSTIGAHEAFEGGAVAQRHERCQIFVVLD